MPNNPPPKALGYIDGDKRKGFDPNKPTYMMSIAEQRLMDAALRRSSKLIHSVADTVPAPERSGG